MFQILGENIYRLFGDGKGYTKEPNLEHAQIEELQKGSIIEEEDMDTSMAQMQVKRQGKT